MTQSTTLSLVAEKVSVVRGGGGGGVSGGCDDGNGMRYICQRMVNLNQSIYVIYEEV